jgi:hypothetical protein
MWLSIALVVVFQAAFPLEIHSALASNLTLWLLSAASVGCLVAFVIARNALANKAKIHYARRDSDAVAQFSSAPSRSTIADSSSEPLVKPSRKRA